MSTLVFASGVGAAILAGGIGAVAMTMLLWRYEIGRIRRGHAPPSHPYIQLVLELCYIGQVAGAAAVAGFFIGLSTSLIWTLLLLAVWLVVISLGEVANALRRSFIARHAPPL